MRKIVFLIAVFSVPLMTFLNVWQVYKYGSLMDEVVELENNQREWIDNNKRAVAGIAVLGSPARIDNIANKDLGLKKVNSDRIINIRIQNQVGGMDG